MKTILSILLTLFILTANAQIHVTPTGAGTGDGSSWENATTLEGSTVANAPSGTAIWVQAGTYNLSATLLVPQGVRLYGGFAGTETDIEQRNFAENPTIIDANLQFGAVTLENDAVLNGFTVQNGLANLATGRTTGGGVLMQLGSRIENSHIIHNVASFSGGGVFALGSTEILSSVIAHNRAGAGGFAVSSGGEMLFQNNTVVDNHCVFPTIASVMDATRCDEGTLTLSAAVAAGNYGLLGVNLRWFANETGGEALGSGPNFTTPNLSVTTYYWVEAYHIGSGCVSARTQVVARIVEAPTAILTSPIATLNQQLNPNETITPITFSYSGGTPTEFVVFWIGTADPSIQPDGIALVSIGNTLTISGAPTTAGLYSFIVTVAPNYALGCYPSGTIWIMSPTASCNRNTPGWGADGLGVITWGGSISPEDNSTIIPGTGGRPDQVWSRAVTASACDDKITFNGGVPGNINTDCRNSDGNINFYGHYFTWCAVMRFAGQLCPYPFRVPTAQDFIDLDLNLGGNGAFRTGIVNGFTIGEQIAWYIGISTEFGQTGSIWGGSRWTGHSLTLSAELSYYWSATEINTMNARSIEIGPSFLNVVSDMFKGNGQALRCVRDEP